MAAEEESSSKVNKVKQLPNFYTECDVLNTPLPFRFVRLNPRFDEQETLLKLKVCAQTDIFKYYSVLSFSMSRFVSADC